MMEGEKQGCPQQEAENRVGRYSCSHAVLSLKIHLFKLEMSDMGMKGPNVAGSRLECVW